MRKVIKHMVELYKKKAKLDIPIKVSFNKTPRVAYAKTLYNKKTKAVISNEIKFNADHFKEMAKVSKKDTSVYLRRTIGHELGHMDHTLKDWEGTRKNYIHKYIPNELMEDYADKFSEKVTGISDAKYDKSMKDLQSKYDEKHGVGKRRR
jgi:hypothetical protein